MDNEKSEIVIGRVFSYDEKTDHARKVEVSYNKEDWKFRVTLTEDNKELVVLESKQTVKIDSPEYNVVKECLEETIERSKKWKSLSEGAKTLFDLLP